MSCELAVANARLRAIRNGIAVLGNSRDLHHKPAGLRTHDFVVLGSAAVIVLLLSTIGAESNALSRVGLAMLLTD